MIEALESRVHLAGDAAAPVRSGRLVLAGGPGNDLFLVTRGSDRSSLSVQVTREGELTFDSLREFSGITRGVRIRTGGGNDRVLFTSVRVPGTVEVEAGDGDDQILFQGARITGRLNIDGGSGEDRIELHNSIVQNDLSITGGAGKDHAEMILVHLRRELDLHDDLGPLGFYARRLSVDRSATLQTGGSRDHLNLIDCTFKSESRISPAGGSDSLFIRGTVFRAPGQIEADPAHDNVDREVLLSWDFRDGAQGWKHGFADYPAGQVTAHDREGNPILAEQDYKLEAGIKPLPKQLGAPGTGYELSGINKSDDLLMFLTRRLGTSDGIQAGRPYLLSFEVKLATNLPSDAIGTPRFLKVGGSGTAPAYLNPGDKLEFPFTANVRLNLDIGIQGNSGKNASIAGIVHTGILGREVYATIHRSHQHPDAIQAGSAGHLWLFVGIDSAYETIATVFMQSIRVRLTPQPWLFGT